MPDDSLIARQLFAFSLGVLRTKLEDTHRRRRRAVSRSHDAEKRSLRIFSLAYASTLLVSLSLFRVASEGEREQLSLGRRAIVVY